MSWSLCLTGDSRAAQTSKTHKPQSHFHASKQRSFPQDTIHCCAKVDRSVGIVFDSRMNTQCNCPSSQRLSHQMARHSHSRWRCLVDARHHQETPGNHSLWGQFVNVVVMKAPSAVREVAWSTNRDSTQTRATNTQTAVGTIIYDATMFLQLVHAQQQWSRFRLIREQMQRDPELTKSIMSNWESGQGCSL